MGTPLSVLFFELLTPWLVMGAVAVICLDLGLSSAAILVVSLGSAIGATFLMREFEKKRRLRQALKGK